MIKLRQVTKFYEPDIYALKGVSLHIRPGEFVSVIGQSGSGKTTVVKLLTAEERLTNGSISLSGWDISNIHHKEVPLLRRQIGVIFQDYKLLPQKTVFENIAFALEACGATHKKIKKIIPQILKVVNLAHKSDMYPRQLSGGEQQRVGIARSLIHRPKILVADEPTGNLDLTNTREIVDLLKKINELGTTVLLVTHNRDVVNMLKRRVIVLDKGQVVSDQKVGRYVL
ncbi:cell division ATP-binding protein FtsE [Candidatus Falkowbacteria bacterium]|jgi:cell division transport system ATP-binding protein|nr:cell division ATP-binding protein FtsE [Candidatus Falkowbacteria bacterium]MBT5503162.1 cell division ATP-binding protein FtsE [Candidatus Falkowbacteria bacterium]MBT6574550.1 cell division ATP-binding protein FtsE [Candidatus Falkowbacteria bacterium]MBT7348835.1 cell division ATP-binding protein FtsE [Candidatus Falkowbacteria bacterium]MBT7500873.1 cell division ATP-binding protein FtsE [Candidatus Falkowbacteria bacterium]